MNIRIKAGLITVGLLSTTIISVLALHTLISVLTAEQITTIIGIGFVGFIVYVLYGITLNRLEYEQRLKEINEKSNT